MYLFEQNKEVKVKSTRNSKQKVQYSLPRKAPWRGRNRVEAKNKRNPVKIFNIMPSNLPESQNKKKQKKIQYPPSKIPKIRAEIFDILFEDTKEEAASCRDI